MFHCGILWMCVLVCVPCGTVYRKNKCRNAAIIYTPYSTQGQPGPWTQRSGMDRVWRRHMLALRIVYWRPLGNHKGHLNFKSPLTPSPVTIGEVHSSVHINFMFCLVFVIGDTWEAWPGSGHSSDVDKSFTILPSTLLNLSIFLIWLFAPSQSPFSVLPFQYKTVILNPLHIITK